MGQIVPAVIVPVNQGPAIEANLTCKVNISASGNGSVASYDSRADAHNPRFRSHYSEHVIPVGNMTNLLAGNPQTVSNPLSMKLPVLLARADVFDIPDGCHARSRYNRCYLHKGLY
jgi:hypothetical protein